MDFRFGLIVLLCLAGLENGIATKYKDCGSTKANVTSVVIEDCPSHPSFSSGPPNPCILKKGHSYNINVSFRSSVESTESKAVVHGIIAGVSVPFKIPDSDGCTSGIKCPIQKGQQYNYLTTLPVKAEYPSLKLVVKWQLLDDNKENLFCIEFPVQIVD